GWGFDIEIWARPSATSFPCGSQAIALVAEVDESMPMTRSRTLLMKPPGRAGDFQVKLTIVKRSRRMQQNWHDGNSHGTLDKADRRDGRGPLDQSGNRQARHGAVREGGDRGEARRARGGSRERARVQGPGRRGLRREHP